jgi:hypothetical protein
MLTFVIFWSKYEYRFATEKPSHLSEIMERTLSIFCYYANKNFKAFFFQVESTFRMIADNFVHSRIILVQTDIKHNS